MYLTNKCFKLTCSLYRNMDFINSIPTHMDYDGQAKAEKFYRVIITLFGVVGIVWGYIIQQFSQTIFILAAGAILAVLISVPPWPMYRKHPLNWQKPRGEPADGANATKKKKK